MVLFFLKNEYLQIMFNFNDSPKIRNYHPIHD